MEVDVHSVLRMCCHSIMPQVSTKRGGRGIARERVVGEGER